MVDPKLVEIAADIALAELTSAPFHVTVAWNPLEGPGIVNATPRGDPEDIARRASAPRQARDQKGESDHGEADQGPPRERRMPGTESNAPTIDLWKCQSGGPMPPGPRLSPCPARSPRGVAQSRVRRTRDDCGIPRGGRGGAEPRSGGGGFGGSSSWPRAIGGASNRLSSARLSGAMAATGVDSLAPPSPRSAARLRPPRGRAT